MSAELETPATREAATADLPHRVVTYEPATNVHEAAERRGIAIDALIKTLVVRRGSGDYLLVLVPGNREIDWAKLRTVLGVRRLSMASPEEAMAATGYAPGTITPFGAAGSWPVLVDATVVPKGEISIGGGAHGVAIHLQATDLLAYLPSSTGDVSRPVGGRTRNAH